MGLVDSLAPETCGCLAGVFRTLLAIFTTPFYLPSLWPTCGYCAMNMSLYTFGLYTHVCGGYTDIVFNQTVKG